MQIYELHISKIISIFSSFALAKGFCLFAANHADSSYIIHNKVFLFFAAKLRTFQLYYTKNAFCACCFLWRFCKLCCSETGFLAFLHLIHWFYVHLTRNKVRKKFTLFSALSHGKPFLYSFVVVLWNFYLPWTKTAFLGFLGQLIDFSLISLKRRFLLFRS